MRHWHYVTIGWNWQLIEKLVFGVTCMYGSIVSMENCIVYIFILLNNLTISTYYII